MADVAPGPLWLLSCQTEMDRIARCQRGQPPVFQAEVPSSGDLDHLTRSPQSAGRGRAVPALNGCWWPGARIASRGDELSVMVDVLP